MGTYDQITALKWIQTYISQFGGNPNKVTIFGESSGGIAVCRLLFSPIAANLFNKVIIQSGACIGPNMLPKPKSIAEENAMSMLSSIFTNNNITLAYLRSLPSTSFIGLPALDAVDGYILPNDDIFSINKLNGEKIMIGSNSFDQLWAWPYDGFGFGAPPSPNNNDELRQYINSYFGQSNDTLYNIIINRYYKPDLFYDVDMYNKYQIVWYSMSADALFVCAPFYLINQILSLDSNIFSGEIYYYQFFGPTSPYYATHFTEVPFVFGNPYILNQPWNNMSWNIDWDQSLSDKMNEVWANFVKDSSHQNLIPYDKIQQNAILFGGGIDVTNEQYYYNDYRNGFCQFLLNQSSEIIYKLAVPFTPVQITTKAPTNNPTNYPTTLVVTESETEVGRATVKSQLIWVILGILSIITFN
eukprot:225011_1